MGYESFLALQYIRPKRKRGFINLITFISIGGVSVSVAALIVVISVMNGFDRDIRDKIIGTNAHVMVNAYGKDGIQGVPQLLGQIRAMEGVVAASPFYQNQGMLKSRAGVHGIVIQGVLPADHTRVANLEGMIKSGDFMALGRKKTGSKKRAPSAFLGAELMENLDANIGDDLTLFSPVFHMTPAGLMPRMAKIRVEGSFKTGFYEYDSGMVYLGLEDAQNLFDAQDVVTQIGVRVADLSEAEEIADRIQALDNGINFWARDWLRMHKNLFTALETEKIIMFLILASMIVVAAFNIVSTLIMIVMEKQKEIGVLKSMGASSMGILKIFLYQGLVVGIFGTLVGFLIGLLVCWLLTIHPIQIPGGGEVYYLEFLPVSVEDFDLAVIFCVSIMVSFLATIYPSWHASRLDPVEAIRYE